MYRSLQKNPKVLLIPGLNNTTESFIPLKDALLAMGFETAIITLPGHGENRDEAHSYSHAEDAFHRQIMQNFDNHYIVVAFSYGALYFQNWLEKHQDKSPICQILLAPALNVKQGRLLEKVVMFSPSFFFIISQTPKMLKRYNRLYLWEYKVLFESIAKFQNLKNKIPVPTLLIIDPKDELLDIGLMKKSLSQTHLKFVEFPRNSIRKELGAHHVLFHPDFFEKQTWSLMLGMIERFMKSEIELKS